MIETDVLKDDMWKMDKWFSDVNIGKVAGIDENVLDRAFDNLGASKEITKDEEESLKKYMFGEASVGMEAVWGRQKMNSFETFRSKWIEDYEKMPGNRELPRTKPSGKVGEGMKRFFLEFTQFAYGLLDEETFIGRTEAAIQNGILWRNREDDKRIKRTTPKSKGEPIRVAELPPGFISDFWKWLKSR